MEIPVYMHHRFQFRSAVQSLGGADYRYAVKGDGQTPLAIVDDAEQRDALETVLSTLSVDFLALPESIVRTIPPPAYRYNLGEIFPGYTEALFDPFAVAEAAAAFTIGEVLHPQRMARLVVYGSLGDYPDLGEVVDRMTEVAWGSRLESNEYRQRILEIVQREAADGMMRQASSATNPATVRAVLADRLERLALGLEERDAPSSHERLVAADIRRWQARIENTVPGDALPLPNGDPIGGSPGSP